MGTAARAAAVRTRQRARVRCPLRENVCRRWTPQRPRPCPRACAYAAWLKICQVSQLEISQIPRVDHCVEETAARLDGVLEDPHVCGDGGAWHARHRGWYLRGGPRRRGAYRASVGAVGERPYRAKHAVAPCWRRHHHRVQELLEDARTLSHPLRRTAAFAQHPQLADEMVARAPLTQHRAHRRRDVHRRCYHWCSGGAQARCCSGGAAGAVL